MTARQYKLGRTFGGPQAAGWQYEWRRQIFRCVIWNLIFRLWVKLHVDGWENIPADGPVVMLGNHIASLDPIVMVSFYPDRDIVPLAKVEAFSLPVERYLLGHWGAIPVNRGAADLGAIKSAIDHIRRGKVVMLYAEGTRSKTGLIKGEVGGAYLALKTNAIVVPVAVWGTRDFPGSLIKNFRRTHVHFRFGRPFCFKKDGGKIPREHFQAMTDEAMYRIAALLPPEWRGVYGDLSQATTHHLDFDIKWRPASRRLPRRVQYQPE